MRVALRELQAVRGDGLLARYAQLGPVTFVHAEYVHGLAGTDLEHECTQEHWGLTLAGDLSVQGTTRRTFGPGTAWHIPAGPPHTFHADGRLVVAGFVPTPEPIVDSEPALERLGFAPVVQPLAVSAMTLDLVPADGLRQDLNRGSIRVTSATQGRLVCMGATFGPRSGYASGWCDVPHWGIVVAGDLIVRYEEAVELLGPGDAYYCPPGPPGHQFEVADSASILDYSPAEDLARRNIRRSAWREAVFPPSTPAASPTPGAGARASGRSGARGGSRAARRMKAEE